VTPPFDLRVQRRAALTVVRLSGELDLETAPRLRDCVDGLVEQGYLAITVDLGAVTFCDSAGLSALVHGYHACASVGGWLRVTGHTGAVDRVLGLTGLRDYLTERRMSA